jgi:predicted PurR-regulated permease PerM
MQIKKQYISIAYIILFALILVGLGWLFSNIVLYFVISLIFSSLLRPVTDYLSDIYFFQIKLPRVLAVFISFIILISILTLFVLLFIPLISEQIRILGSLDLEKLLGYFTKTIASIENFVIRVLPIERQPGFLSEALQENLFNFLEQLEVSYIINFTIQFSTAFFVAVLAVVFITFFLLYERGLLRRNIIQLIPNKYFELTITALHKVEKLLSNYLLGLSLQIFSIFSLTALGLTMAGINYALTIALFAALVNVVPYIGPVVGTVFAIVVGLSTTNLPDIPDASLFALIKILLVFIIVHLIDNLISQPLIFSKSVKAHPLEIFVAIFAGATLAGPIGMIAAIPVYTIIRVSVIEFRKGYKQYHVFKE